MRKIAILLSILTLAGCNREATEETRKDLERFWAFVKATPKEMALIYMLASGGFALFLYWIWFSKNAPLGGGEGHSSGCGAVTVFLIVGILALAFFIRIIFVWP